MCGGVAAVVPAVAPSLVDGITELFATCAAAGYAHATHATHHRVAATRGLGWAVYGTVAGVVCPRVAMPGACRHDSAPTQRRRAQYDAACHFEPYAEHRPSQSAPSNGPSTGPSTGSSPGATPYSESIKAKVGGSHMPPAAPAAVAACDEQSDAIQGCALRSQSALRGGNAARLQEAAAILAQLSMAAKEAGEETSAGQHPYPIPRAARARLETRLPAPLSETKGSALLPPSLPASQQSRCNAE